MNNAHPVSPGQRTRVRKRLSTSRMKQLAPHLLARLRHVALACAALWLSACSVVQYRPVETIRQSNTHTGYRLKNALEHAQQKENMVIMMFSGGGTRAAAFGYGVLEELHRNPIRLQGQDRSWLDSVDLVYGVSGGSVLAAYFSLHGKDAIPAFEKRFLKQNFQRQLRSQFWSFANMPRLTSPEFGRGDLLQEQFESTLFGNTTFDDLAQRRKGPFAVISATDMAAGKRLDFTQEYFDVLCLNLSDLRVARAVAASSAVPLVFAPVTLNNNGGNCGYALPAPIQQALNGSDQHLLQNQNRLEYLNHVQHYANIRERPYLHLLDGGLTDNLGLHDLPASPLRRQLLNIPTTFYLPPDDINQLKSAAPILLKQSTEYQRLLQDLAAETTPKP